MKQIISLFLILAFWMKAGAQDSLQKPLQAIDKSHEHQSKPIKYSKDYFMVRSSKLNTAAWVFLSVGAVMGTVGWIVYENQIHSETTLDQLGDAVANTFGGEVLAVVGTGMVITSIPLFIVSGHYKKKSMAMSASVSMESYRGLTSNSGFMTRYPAVGLVIRW